MGNLHRALFKTAGSKRAGIEALGNIGEVSSGPRYTKPGLQEEENQAHHKYKKNNTMPGGLVILYPA